MKGEKIMGTKEARSWGPDAAMERNWGCIVSKMENFFSKSFFLFLAIPWHLSSPVRGGAHAPAVEVLSPNHWTSREVLGLGTFKEWWQA